MARHVNIRVTGKVQGVFYRATAKDVADKLGVKGFVRNESDRTVYMEAEGEEATIDKFLEWCKQGPPRATVSKVEVTDGALRSFPNFEVKRF